MQPSQDAIQQELERLRAQTRRQQEEIALLRQQLELQRLRELNARQQEEIAQLREQLDVSAPVPSPPPDQPTTAAVASSRRDPDDDWGEGPDPGRDLPAATTKPEVRLRAEYQEIVKHLVIDMEPLNEQGGTVAEHLAAIRPELKEQMRALLDSMGAYRIYIHYWVLMSHLKQAQGVRISSLLFSFFDCIFLTSWLFS
jgi:hypothetical protein